jgi:hypothetical protein
LAVYTLSFVLGALSHMPARDYALMRDEEELIAFVLGIKAPE